MTAGWDCGDRQSMVGQDVVDGLVVILPEALQDYEVRGADGQEQLSDHFIGTAQVHLLDIREIEQGGEAL